jgi:hypothetical protein
MIQWGHLFNHEIDNNQANRNNFSAESWDKEIILLTWEFTHNIWITRNKIEHDTEGKPNIKTKQKIIEHILGISNIKGPQPYTIEELTNDKLITMTTPNLRTILENIKMKRRREKKKRQKTRKKLREIHNSTQNQ